MSFLAKFEIDGDSHNVLKCSFRIIKPTDETGKVRSRPIGGEIKLVIESYESTNLFDWVIGVKELKDGSITFYRRDSSSRFKTLEFSDGQCVDYEESYSHDGNVPMIIDLKLSCRVIKLNDSEFQNDWPS